MFACPIGLKRSSSLSGEYLINMRMPSVNLLVNDLERCGEELTTLVEALVARLEFDIKTLHDDDSIGRKKYITLKRDVYNRRNISLNDIAAIQDKESIGLLMKYMSSKDKIQTLQHELSTEYRGAMENARRVLQIVYKEQPLLINATKFINSTIEYKIDKYVNTDIDLHTAKERKAEYTLLKLLSRTVMKPSPFSTFTTVNPIQIDGSDPIDVNLEPPEHFVIARINNVHILRIFDALTNHPDVLRRIPFELNRSIAHEEDGYSLMRLIDDPVNQSKLFKCLNQLIRVPGNKFIDLIYTSFKEKETFYYGDILELTNNSIDETKILALVEKLLDLGFINKGTTLDEYGHRIIDSVTELIAKNGLQDITIVGNVRNILAAIDQSIQEYNSYSVDMIDQRNSTYAEIEGRVKETFELLNANMGRERAIVYEDSVTTTVQKVDTISSQCKEDLFLLGQLATVFDSATRAQSYLGKLFQERFGSSATVPSSNQEMIKMILSSNSRYDYVWRNDWLSSPHDDELPSNRKLDSVKSEFLQYLHKIYTENKHADTIKLSREVIRDILSQVPQEVRTRTSSYDVFIQEAGDGHFVVNNIYRGYQVYLSRFIDYFSFSNMKSYTDYVRWLFDGGIKIAEVQEYFGFNANVHKSISNYKFVTGLSARRNDSYDSQEILKWSDMSYQYEENEGRVILSHPSFGKFMVLYLGSLVPIMLPSVFGLLNSMFTGFRHTVGIMTLLGDLESPIDQIVHVPRIEFGTLILQRQMWYIPTFVIPRREKGQSDLDYYLALNLWLKDSQLPRECFIKYVIRPSEFEKWFRDSNDPNHNSLDFSDKKPMYMDFDNPIFVRLFEKFIESERTIILEECNPSPKEGSFIEEYLIEISEKGAEAHAHIQS